MALHSDTEVSTKIPGVEASSILWIAQLLSGEV